jgi:hypothetical protein
MSELEMVQVSKADRDKWLARERKAQLSARRASTKTALLAEKAKKAGITVSKEEINAKIAEQDAKKAPVAALEPISSQSVDEDEELAA